MESARDFLQSIEDFIHQKALELAAARTNKGLPDGLDKQKHTRWKHHGSQIQSKVSTAFSQQALIERSEINQDCD